MNYPASTGPWTPEQIAEAMLDVAVKQAPGWADQAWLLATMARDAAPPDEKASWIEKVEASFTLDLANLCNRIAADAGANPDQVHRFAHEVKAAMDARFGELTATGTHQSGTA